jgi:hypothetical protein
LTAFSRLRKKLSDYLAAGFGKYVHAEESFIKSGIDPRASLKYEKMLKVLLIMEMPSYSR